MGILPMMYASLSLLILGSLGKLMALASGVLTSHNPGEKPSGATLDGCRTSCGNLSFNYPFGIGSRCSHGPDFDLTCNETVGVDSPRLFFRDGITEVIGNINVITNGNYYGPNTYIRASFFRTIPMKSGVRVYHMPLKPPGSSFTIGGYTILNITGCDLDVYLVDADKLRSIWLCRTVCPDQAITEMVAMRNCNGVGCCRVQVVTPEAYSFHFKFVQARNKSNIEARSNQSSQLWDRISVTTDRPSGFSLSWSIRDQPTCVDAMRNRTTYACVSEHTECLDSATYDCSRDPDTTCIHGGMASTNGYSCICDIGYAGNPYVLDGCSNDKGYNPVPSRTNCTRWCGNISVQFPFGLEDGCFAREQFHLNCTNTTSSAVLQRNSYQVIDMNISEGTIKFAQLFDTASALFGDFELSVKWAAANLSCLEAQQNISGYACVSMNSKCVAVNTEYEYVGYHCKCLDGFQGNPYLQSGCRDVDECREANNCQGICHNTEGSFYCTNCPPKTEYDASKMRCTTTKQQILLLGITIGLSCGFSILILSFITLFLIRRRNKYIQNQLRKKYFRKNQGLLLETLISSDETAHDRTKIFSLEELEKATNNFDPTRIIGRGGHGMVYKGMLFDQRVVAIKKSKVIEQCEISQFINEVAVLTQINHRNIVKLFGCCLETEVPLLVYDYVSSGSLSQVLHADASNGLSLSWGDYLRIALETAGALSYLHSAASVSIFHRDVKSSNILLDGNYTAKVSDFGASRLVPIDQTHIVTNVQGTFGYLDPEYIYTRQLNGKSDVYSFGVVLVELLLRMKPVFTSESGTIRGLSSYFLQEFNEGRITGIVNAQVLEEATEEEINSVASLAERCLRLHGEERPTMKHVEMELQALQKKRMNISQADLRNEEPMQPRSLTRRTRSSRQSSVRPGDSQRCYSLEAEFLSSASLPR